MPRWEAQRVRVAKDLVRCALSLKFLLFSETGAIAAAATAGLPERIGGDKNYDYRFAWVRDAAYTIEALLRAGALSEPIAAFGWLVRTIEADGPEPKVVYTLRGNEVPDEEVIQVPGYLGSSPVRRGNRAKQQVQLSCYGDFLETASLFAKMGHVLDPAASKLLARLADQVVERWHLKDSGIWDWRISSITQSQKLGTGWRWTGRYSWQRRGTSRASIKTLGRRSAIIFAIGLTKTAGRTRSRRTHSMQA